MADRFLSKPKDFTWDELVRLLAVVGYSELKSGKTGGSRRRFTNAAMVMIYFHKPHPGNIVKLYVLEQLLDFPNKQNTDKTYKGSFNVRIPAELHKEAALFAANKKVSLNDFIRTAIDFSLSNKGTLNKRMTTNS